ncbi:hypothetical protein BJ741DRAFT_583699 [Chytriomyces cf. hyalinus JEL632]|nr:hypothetical protein BJ741DRAFT_583699 [Chytriomyces cf. hyalinus JEL632]
MEGVGVQTELAEMVANIREIQKEFTEGIINLDKAAEERQTALVEYYRTQIQSNLQRERDLRKHLEIAINTERAKARKALEKERERKDLEREITRTSNTFARTLNKIGSFPCFFSKYTYEKI